jgi:predicted GNAT family acetyltransferase
MTIDKTLSNQSNQPKVAANQSQGQQVISNVETLTIDQIRKQGLAPEVLEKIHADKAEMNRLEKENAERIKGNYISFKDDKETKALLFTGKYQKLNVPAKDFATSEIIPNKFVTKWRFEVYDVTNPNNPSDVSVWERGWNQAKVVMHFLEQKKAELVVVRNGAKGSNTTTYLIYPK